MEQVVNLAFTNFNFVTARKSLNNQLWGLKRNLINGIDYSKIRNRLELGTFNDFVLRATMVLWVSGHSGVILVRTFSYSEAPKLIDF